KRRTRAVIERIGWLALGVLATLAVMRLPHRAPPPPAVAVTPKAPDPLEPPAPVPVVQPPAQFHGLPGAQAAAPASRKCFDRIDRTVAFGVGLLFAAGHAEVHKAYLASDELAPETRRCLAHTLPGLSAAAPPPKGLVVEARFKLRPDGSDDVKVK